MDWAEIEKEVASKTVDALKTKNITLSDGFGLANDSLKLSDSVLLGDLSVTTGGGGGGTHMDTSTFRIEATNQMLSGEVSRLQATVKDQAARLKALEGMMATFGDALENQANSTRSGFSQLGNRIGEVQEETDKATQGPAPSVSHVEALAERCRQTDERVDEVHAKLGAVTEASESLLQFIHDLMAQVSELRGGFQEVRGRALQSSSFAETLLRAVLSLTGKNPIPSSSSSSSSSSSLSSTSTGEQKVGPKFAAAEAAGGNAVDMKANEMSQMLYDAMANVVEKYIRGNSLGSLQDMKQRMLDMQDLSHRLETSRADDVERFKGLESRTETMHSLLSTMVASVSMHETTVKKHDRFLNEVSDKVSLTTVAVNSFQDRVDAIKATVDGKCMEMRAQISMVSNDFRTAQSSMEALAKRAESTPVTEASPMRDSSHIRKEKEILASMKISLEEFDSRLTTALDDMAPMSKRLTALEEGAEKQDARVSAVATGMRKQDDRVLCLETAMQSRQDGMGTANATKLSELESANASFEGALAGVREQLSSLTEQCSQLATDQRSFRQETTAKHEDFATASGLNAFGGRLKAVQSSVTAIQAELASIQDMQTETQMLVMQAKKSVSPSQKDAPGVGSSSSSSSSSSNSIEPTTPAPRYSDKLSSSSEKVVVIENTQGTQEEVVESPPAKDEEKCSETGTGSGTKDARNGEEQTQGRSPNRDGGGERVEADEDEDEGEVMEIEDDVFSSSSGSSIEDMGDLSVSIHDSTHDSDDDGLLAGIGSHVRGSRKVPSPAKKASPTSPSTGGRAALQDSSNESDSDADGFVDHRAEGQGRENIVSKLRGLSPARGSPGKDAGRGLIPNSPGAPSDVVNRQLAAAAELEFGTTKVSSPLPSLTGSLMRRASHKPSQQAKTGYEHAALVRSLNEEATSSDAATTAAAQRATTAATVRAKSPPRPNIPPSPPTTPGRGGRSDTAQCNYCLRRMPKADMEGHLSTCALRMEVCSGGCGQRIRYIKMEKHLRDECPKRKGNPTPPPPPSVPN